MTKQKRPLHTMTPDEFRAWTNGGPEITDTYATMRIMQLTKSLANFYKFLSGYGNFDSITWLVKNDFDLNFTEARKDGNALL